MMIKTLALGASFVMVAACGAFDTKDSGRKADEVDSELNGTWSSACLDTSFVGLTQSRETFAFSGLADFDKTTEIFTDACNTQAASLLVTGTYAKTGDADVVDGAKNINFTITGAALTPKTDDTARLLNRASYCGVTDWARDQEVDILGKDCAGESYANGDVVFDIYKVGDEELRFGQSGLIFFDGSNASDRPRELSDERIFSKQ